MKPFQVKEAAAWLQKAGMNVSVIGNEEALITRVVTDSRAAEQGCLFEAIKGERMDGHRFIGSFFEKGGTAALSQLPAAEVCPDGVPEGCALILVPDTLKATGLISKAYKEQFTIQSIGVTGSVGKTSCKDMIEAALSGGLRTIKTQGNFNNNIGLPLTLFSIDETTEAAVIEMGMNHFGEIDYLASLAKPDMGVITNIGTAHIEMLGSREGIRKAKLEIVPHLRKGPLFINGDDDMLLAVKDQLGISVETFGYGENNDGIVKLVETTEDARLHVVLAYQNEIYDFILNTMGKHMAVNAMPAVMAARHMGLSKEEILRGFAHYKPTPKRMERIQMKDFLVINDTYNANPISVKPALDTLVSLPGETRRVAILGDMYELGDYTKKAHEEVGAFAAGHTADSGKMLDVLVSVGPLSRDAYEKAVQERPDLEAYYFESKEALEKNVLSILKENDIILLKASHGVDLSTILDTLRAGK